MRQDTVAETTANIIDAEQSSAAAERGSRNGNTRVSREDWLHAASDALINHGVERVKVLSLADRLKVSRSSFYWHFKSRRELLDILLDQWERTNTGAIIAHTELPAGSITQAVGNLFHCFIDDHRFNPKLDFAVREWARRSAPVRKVIDRSDALRVEAIRNMFVRHGYGADEADMRARVLYFMQVGYYALELHEPLEQRITRVPGYLYGFTGEHATSEEIEAFRSFATKLKQRKTR